MAGPIKFRHFDKIDYNKEFKAEIQRADEFYNKTKGILDGIEEPAGGLFGFFNYYLSDRPIVEEQVNLFERKITPLKSKLEAAVEKIKSFKKQLDNRDLTEEKTKELLKGLLNNEKEFIVTQRELTALKIAVLNRFNQLPSLDVVISEQALNIEDFNTRYTSLMQEINEVQMLINAIVHPPKPKPILTQLDVEVQKNRLEFSTEFHKTMDFYLGVKGKLGSPEAKKMGKEMSGEYENLMEMQQELGNAQTTAEFDELKYRYHTALQNFDIKLMDVLFERRGNLNIRRSMQDLGKLLRERRSFLIELREEAPGKYVSSGESETLPINIKAQVEEVWKFRPWARLLKPTSYTAAVGDTFGTSFEQTITRLRNECDALKKRIDMTEPNTDDRNTLEKQKGAIDKASYHVLLQRIIDVIGEKQRVYWQWRDGKRDLSQEKINELFADIDILQIKWEKTFKLFKKLEIRKQTLLQAIEVTGLEKLISTLSLGFYNIKDLQADDYEQMKHYADLGYSPAENIKEWLNTLTIPEGKEPFEYLSDQLFEFFDWAEKYPVTASKMIGDMALTAMILFSKNEDNDLINRFKKLVETEAIIIAAIAPHGVRELKPPPKKEELKYKALADVAGFFPGLVGVGDQVINDILEGNFGWKTIYKAYLGGVRVELSKQAAALIPPEAKRLATAAAGALKDESLHQIIETQGKIQLVQTASIAREAVFKPKNFIKNMGRKLRLWVVTMRKARGKELFYRIGTQIGVPFALTTGGFFLLGIAIFGGPFTIAIATALWLSAFLFGSSITIPWRANRLLNKMYSNTQKKALKQYESDRLEKMSDKHFMQSIKENIKAKGRKKLEEVCNDTIYELQVHQQIPYTSSQPEFKLSKNDEDIVKELVAEYKKKLVAEDKKELVTEDKDELGSSKQKDPIKHFNDKFSLNDVEEKALEKIAVAAAASAKKKEASAKAEEPSAKTEEATAKTEEDSAKTEEDSAKTEEDSAKKKKDFKEYLDPVTKNLKVREITHKVYQELLNKWLFKAIIKKMTNDLAKAAADGKLAELETVKNVEEALKYNKKIKDTTRERLNNLFNTNREKMKKPGTAAG